MDSQRKKNLTLFLGLAVAALVLLASSLSQVSLHPGLPLPAYNAGRWSVQDTPSTPGTYIEISEFLRVLAGIVLAAALLYVLYRLLLGAEWKRLLWGAVKFILITLGVILFLALAFLLLPSLPAPVDELPLPPPTLPALTLPLGSPPNLLLWLVGIGLALLAAFLVYSVLTYRRKRSQMSQLVSQVEQAHKSLLAGLALKEVILRCYQQMSETLQQEAGIERQPYMTPAEFERSLANQGFPTAPVRQLTRLFEGTRYGNWTPNPWDDQVALDSLQAILTHLQGRQGGQKE